MKAGTFTQHFMKENSLQIDWFKVLEKFGFPIFIALILLWNSWDGQNFYKKLIENQDQKNTAERQIFLDELHKQSELHQQAFEKINDQLDSLTLQVERKKTK